MYIYPQRKKDKYDRISSIISASFMALLIIISCLFSVSFNFNKKGIYEKKHDNKISLAVVKKAKPVKERVKKELPSPNARKKEVKEEEPEMPETEENTDSVTEENIPDDFVKEEAGEDSQMSSENERDAIIAELVALIDKKKRYPTAARRRNITGTVVILIHINSSSVISGYEISSYKNKLLKNSADKVMQQILNIKLSSKTSKEFSVKIPVKYTLK